MIHKFSASKLNANIIDTIGELVKLSATVQQFMTEMDDDSLQALQVVVDRYNASSEAVTASLHSLVKIVADAEEKDEDGNANVVVAQTNNGFKMI